MKLVTVENIPQLADIKDVPTDNLLEVYKVCKQMEILCDIEQGIGLSAVQVGIPWKLFLVRLDAKSKFKPTGRYGYFLNCKYDILAEDVVASLEGCLSLRSPEGRARIFQVKRCLKTRISGFQLIDINKLDIIEISQEMTLPQDNESIVFQHEIDHHFGKLISDSGNKELYIW